MLGLLSILALVAQPTTPEPMAFGARLRESAAAAQALQGPLDGSWTLYDAGHRPLYHLQITDPAGGAGPLEAAWGGPLASSPSGGVTTITRLGDHLTLGFTPVGEGAAIVGRLTHRDADGWSGWITQGGRARRVTLKRWRVSAN